MKQRSFERAEHVYRNDAFAERVKDAVRFLNGTPVLPLPPPASFEGRGVYAIYYIGKYPLYARYAELNRALPTTQKTNQVNFSADYGSIIYCRA
jgi:hypothetical protein